MLKLFRNVLVKIGEFWTTIAKNELNFDIETANMRKCLTKFSWIFEFGAVLTRTRIWIKGKLMGLTKQDKEEGYFAVLTRTCRAACYLHHPGAVPRVTGFIFWISVLPTPAGRAACPCAPSFRDFPRHRCCGLIASFPGPCASSGGRLPEALFMVFYWIPKVQKRSSSYSY